MRIFDAHCDTIYELDCRGLELCKNPLQLDLERMSEYDGYIQVFAAFVDKTDIKTSPMKHVLKLIDTYKSETEKNAGKISIIETAEDLKNAHLSAGVHSILSIEGGEALEGSISALRMFHRLGVRLITLTWNHANELADGITEGRGAGLTDFGKAAVSEMERLGILIDVSHLSEAGFWDVDSCTKYPYVASHSCAKTLCSHPRNLTDDQIRAIAEKGGCIGVNFYPEFLSDNGICGMERLAEHIEYMIDVGGEDAVGLGSDFDGVDRLPEGICGVESMKHLAALLSGRGMTDRCLEKIFYGNFYRVFSEVLGRNG